jgi:hypothetical protein
MIALTIWAHPTNAQPFEREDVMTGEAADVPKLAAKVSELGFEFCTEVLGRYLFVSPNTTDTACIAVVR